MHVCALSRAMDPRAWPAKITTFFTGPLRPSQIHGLKRLCDGAIFVPVSKPSARCVFSAFCRERRIDPTIQAKPGRTTFSIKTVLNSRGVVGTEALPFDQCCPRPV
ncbi:hypothetical protein ARMGADRAFT_291644 [Armillaria gallica]|uniref:Uncharacterized protein n=1 Tax=Armillaria gallica TaxID=47427 RepID=A0A2H3DAC0_ARMGA|nr:hypothetical protein ARMGADRAFT_291644 [Armillaria gallica]